MGTGVSLVLAFALTLGGALLIASGIRNQSLGEVLKSTIPIKATAANSSSQATGLSTEARSKLTALAKGAGWDAAEEKAWLAVIGRESGGNPKAVNGSTGAYGIGQINPENASSPLQPRAGSTASQYPKYAGNAIEQVEAMFEYLVKDYGTPSKALASEESRGYY